MTFSWVRLLTLCFAAVAQAQAQAQNFNRQRQAPCATPQGSRGQCVLLQDCKPLFALFQSSRTPETREYLNRLRCDPNERYMRVCCDGNPVAEATTPPRRPTPRPTPATTPTKSPFIGQPTDENTPTAQGSLIKHRNINLLPLEDCGVESSNRIHGGNVTALDEFPWATLLQFERGGQRSFECGGSLISNRYVLTAAHCTNKGTTGMFKLVGVRLGEHNTGTNPDCEQVSGGRWCADSPINLGIEEEIVHPQYRAGSKNQYNDIALLRLTAEVPFTGFISPVCIPTDDKLIRNSFTGKNMTATGWGRTETERKSPVKMKAMLPVVKNADCAPIYAKSQRTITNSQLCAGGVQGVDVCTGDSGGPLMTAAYVNDMLRYHIMGIVSFGSSACHWGQPGVYTKVATYSRWILDQLKP